MTLWSDIIQVHTVIVQLLAAKMHGFEC